MSTTLQVSQQIMWNRLISVVEEQALTLIRTAFCTSVREAGDLSAGVFDASGRMVAQAVTGTPGHVNTMAETVFHFIDQFGDTMVPGDVFVTNDPWLATGHLHDFTVVTPVFREGRRIGFFASTAHVVDIGGRGFGPDGRELYEEGLLIPPLRMFKAGVVNQDLVDILTNNVRESDQVVGDFFSLSVCNDTGRKRLLEMLDEFSLPDIEELATFIFAHSERATREKLAALPAGEYRYRMPLDGYDAPVELAVTLSCGGETLNADFTGTSAQSGFGINVPLTYTKAYACYGLKCALAPSIPNNWASLRPFTVSAPDDCILNAQRPAPVAARHVLGHLVPDLVLGALRQACPTLPPAEGASALWNLQISARPTHGTGVGREILMFNSGGSGARPTLDGLNATAFPSGVMTMPVEVTESVGPLVIWRKELRPDSGGAGRQRGGLGQTIELSAREGYALTFNAMFERVEHPARGHNGGRNGGIGVVALDDGTRLRAKGRQAIPTGRRLILHLPGGGGYGAPQDRPAASVARDVEAGYVSELEARTSYPHAF
ncbi:hydantoinase B/oxoprolinase family protein [Salinicola rhizosphaerae]|uniref:N-methylhydantoinase B n=1 Tax=Salinicola rhizosphaerae TaxID=1443141 RepID=A0ABQ3DSX3_9GAMM|nr:hydantoinase B/oxoprolinase family protein [Salinicola rhizosphaerae]GHB11193.1 N-methylhydantoinase B [Salinicola rhizosphaerae]